MDEVEFLRFLWSSDVRREVRVHESFEVGTPPLGEGFADVPVGVCLRKGAGGSEALVETVLEAFYFIDVVGEVVAGAVTPEESISIVREEVWDVRTA